jgi:uncharacterized protein YjbI with pentapeptide repeats
MMGSNLSGMACQAVSFAKSFLCKSNLDRSTFISCALDECSLWSSSMNKTQIISCTLKNACLDLAQGGSAMITRCDAEECSARSSTLVNCNLAGTNWTGADFSVADLSGSLLQDCNMTSCLLYDANLDGCDLSAACINWANVWSLCGQDSEAPAPLVTSAAKTSEGLCCRLPLQSLADEAQHILQLALKALEADEVADFSSSSSSSTDAMIALARSQAAAASKEAHQLSVAAANDTENMLKNFPNDVLESIIAMVEAGTHGARTHHLPTLMGMRCVGKAGKPILRGLDLRYTYFSRCRLKSIDLSACNLTAASFIDCDLTEAKIATAITDGLVLNGSLLHSIDMGWMELLNKARDDVDSDERVCVVGCSFKPFKLPPDCTIARVDLSFCRIVDAVVPNIKLQNVTLRGAKLARDLAIVAPPLRVQLLTNPCAICNVFIVSMQFACADVARSV